MCRSVLHLKKMHSRLPRKNPSTSLRLIPLPLGKGGADFLGCGVRRGTWAPPYSRAFCRAGAGGRGMRIVTGAVRPCNDRGLYLGCGARPGGSSGRPTPTHCLPIELRRGRRPRRPVASQVAGGRKDCPCGSGCFNFPCGGPGRQKRFAPAYIRFPRGIALLQRRKAPDPAHRPGRG